jgi:hypothetical protein
MRIDTFIRMSPVASHLRGLLLLNWAKGQVTFKKTQEWYQPGSFMRALVKLAWAEKDRLLIRNGTWIGKIQLGSRRCITNKTAISSTSPIRYNLS